MPQLPDRFVLKDTLGSGGNAVLLCPDKDRADWRAIRKTAAGWCATPLVRDGGREWPYYSGKPHRILAEEYLQPAAGPLTDYKFFCFGGKCAFVYVCTGRHNGSAVEIHIVSPSYEKLPVVRVGDEPSDRLPDRPENFGEMVRLAEAISAPFPHVRVDLYNVDGLIRFGELTFFNASGYMLYEPDCFDREIGDRFSLPQRRERPGGGAS